MKKNKIPKNLDIEDYIEKWEKEEEEKERQEKEKLEKERQEREKQEKERQEREKLEKEKQEKDKISTYNIFDTFNQKPKEFRRTIRFTDKKLQNVYERKDAQLREEKRKLDYLKVMPKVQKEQEER